MKKKELIEIISNKTGFSKQEITTILDAAVDETVEALRDGKELKIFGFGKFITRSYGARKCFNPITGKEIILKPSIQPAFVPGTKLREQLNK